MRSLADDLRSELRQRVAELSPAERIDLALRLGADDVRALATSRGISEAEARRIFTRARALGRQPSVANDDAMMPREIPITATTP
jgi:hypothetical protein